ncbi:hypothetical protein N864_00075 [Intrasporangium chromatireducens Q5-1]|uniref:Esterase n=1 Tax=Intrasporangium chromatireducens Q5-1 TaxID=584657 RepID=W9GMJ0_9MICO|nr:alpha/beta hydrolase-fold protein [Intrasporangium chromatireducens]EWT07481.1 hypothetical protein N864_00075 [Intrasporangium chromatireducens Q5-1]
MELTDPGPLIILGVLAAAFFTLVVIGWPRPRLRGLRIGIRAVEVLLLNAVVVVTAFALLNDQYVFYSSWADLLGSRSAQTQLHQGGSNRTVIASKVGAGALHQQGPTNYALPQAGSRLQTYSVLDRASGTYVPVVVYLPAGYNPASPRRYPVIVGLHGFPGTPISFLHPNAFVATADRMTSEHRLASTIFIIPTIDTPVYVDTECINGPPGQPQTDTWLARDVPAWAVQHLHVSTARTSWATMGYSYGGWCAAELALRHPSIFAAAVVFQGYFRPDFGAGYDPLTPKELLPYDLVRLARLAPPPVALWVFTTRQDTLSYPTTARFLSVARAPLDVQAVILNTGGHRASLYAPYCPAALTWLASTLPGFRA